MEVCPQCNNSSNDRSNRLIQDSCGHKKCRLCLLNDEEKCGQCKTKQKTVIEFENIQTGVITCNGKPKPTKVCNLIDNDNRPNESETKAQAIEAEKNVDKNLPNNIKLNESKSKTSNNTSKRTYRKLVFPEHITTLSSNPEKYKCIICNKQFSTKAHIKYHIYCTGQLKPFACETCNKRFVTLSHLEIHKLKHSGSKPFTCNLCDKSFKERNKLNRHKLLHTTIKQYVCSECGKAFRGKESLKIHTLIHRGEKPHSCQICKAAFTDNSNLKKHLLTHSTEKTNMCDQCGKRFKQKYALTVHRRSHLRIRPHECTTCSKTFVNKKDLQRHQLIHLDFTFLENAAFVCSICKTGFRRKDNLYRHIKNTHPGKRVEAVKDIIVKDTPNAINVITSALSAARQSDSCDKAEATYINGPVKLAFKTNAFKNNYNIHRNCDDEYMNKLWKPYDLAESVNICQKILSPHSPPLRKSDQVEVLQKTLPLATQLHYETSFEQKSHAMIKNIKFKLPANYTNLKANDTAKDVLPSILKPGFNGPQDKTDFSNTNGITTSVIVNSSFNQLDHWRRRTSQNLFSKNVDS